MSVLVSTRSNICQQCQSPFRCKSQPEPDAPFSTGAWRETALYARVFNSRMTLGELVKKSSLETVTQAQLAAASRLMNGTHEIGNDKLASRPDPRWEDEH